ncbi:ROK family protein [Sphaerothrix gracilis]|uniref:ROK family protein n=1 Tax=Sphaerothrix gracilis TaxID=3151835 RepID=UPI0031FDA897
MTQDPAKAKTNAKAAKSAAKSKTAKSTSTRTKKAASRRKSSSQAKADVKPVATKTLAVDIGGSGIKALVLDSQGQPVTDRLRIDTPHPATPEAVVATVSHLAAEQGDFDRVAVGFPGVIRSGLTLTAVNLDGAWQGYNLQTALEQVTKRPVRIANDADIQGWGATQGQGVELVLTLGTGFGSALFVDGRLVPNLELAHHPFRKGKTYEEQLGRAALEKAGQKKWNKRLKKAIAQIQHLFNYDHLYIGGGETDKISFELPENVTIVSNQLGLLGGIKLWQ